MTTNEPAGCENSPTSDDGAARRELIGRCAAKTAGMVGAAAERYVRYVRNRLVLQPQEQASGAAWPLEKGIRVGFLRAAWPGFLLLAVSMGTAIFLPDFWVQSLFIAVIGLVFGVAQGFSQVWNWREQLRTAGSTMLPKPGTSICADSQSLTVSATATPWSQVRLEAVELRYLWQPRIYPLFRVDQLRIATSNGPLVLDVCLIENGQAVVDTIADKLCLTERN